MTDDIIAHYRGDADTMSRVLVKADAMVLDHQNVAFLFDPAGKALVDLGAIGECRCNIDEAKAVLALHGTQK